MLYLYKILIGFWHFTKWLWDFIGFRFVFQKLLPPVDQDTGKRKPITFILWCLGIYVAFFGIASQRYENRVDIIENRANAIFTQLATPIYEKALGRISRVQRMPCPVKPEFWKLCTVCRSLFSKDMLYTEMIVLLKETVENWRGSLSKVDLRSVLKNKVKFARFHQLELLPKSRGADGSPAKLFYNDGSRST
ncbi:MAG: hypothetical protein U9P14_04960, partial [Gemmatimonadota bacterium]|nr:hypothetical protein [Gemmatimonadota bacterium]